MAEENNEEQPGRAGMSPIIKYALGAVIILGAAGGGFATYQFVIAPMLSTEEGQDEAAAEPMMDEIPMNPVMITFEDSFVNVVREKDFPAATLVFGVTLECANQETAALVEAHKPRFRDMVNKLHDSRTRDELDDTLTIKESIQRQIEQKANDILERLQGTPNPSIRVTDVFHQTFAVQDQI